MNWKPFVPHAIAVFILLALAAVFYAPNAFNGKVLPQPDNEKARGMQAEIQEYIKKGEESPLWTNSAFGGMPSYQIYAPIKGNLTNPVSKILFLGGDYTSVWAQTFVAMLCMYLLIVILGADWRVALFGAITYGITSYNADILEAGHSTKMKALALAPGVLAGLVLTFRPNYRLLGAGVMGLFLAIQVLANHVQITYYCLLLAGIYGIARLVWAIQHKDIMGWVVSAALAAAAVALGFASNLSRLWPTYEYSQETIRGKSDLAARKSKGDGLDKDYLFGWSYGVGESFTLLVPRYAGGGANESFTNTGLYKKLRAQYGQQMNAQQAAQQTAGLMYTGSQPFVGTAIYFGAIVCFLFLLGAILVPGDTKWWLLTGGIFSIMLAWGKNFFLNDILYEVLPMFNKFRAVSMALGLGQLCFAALGALGLQALAGSQIPAERKRKALFISAGGAILLCLLAIVFAPDGGQRDEMLAQVPELLRLLKQDRTAMVRGDAYRSIAFIVGAAAMLWLYLRGTLKAGVAIIAVALLALADHALVARRTLDNDKFTSPKEALATPPMEAFDEQIKKDPDPHYRVLDLARGGITGNAITSFFHKSLSGYHAAKLQRYQEVVDSVLNEDLAGSLAVIGMFNGKYIVNQEGKVISNPKAAGHAWFVKNIQTVSTADAELKALRTLNPVDSAVIDQAYATALQGMVLQPDSTATIRLTKYHPDRMEYEYSANTEQLAVFPEIYYPPTKGWKTFINGQPAADFFKINYLLRGMRLPAGQNMKLEMRFEPRSYYFGETIAMIASGILLAAFAIFMFLYFRKSTLEDPNKLADVEKIEKPKPTTARVETKAPAGKGKKK